MSKRGWSVCFVLAALLVVTAVLSGILLVDAQKNEAGIAAADDRAFYELSEHTEAIARTLIKASASSDAYQLMRSAAQIKENAAFAISDLGHLPAGEETLTNIMMFLNQAGDYAEVVAMKHSDGSKPSREESEHFTVLADYAGRLKTAIDSMYEALSSGELSIRDAGKGIKTLAQSLGTIEQEQFHDYESMEYDGPFSEHMNTLESVMLKEQKEVSEEEALKIAMDCFSGNVALSAEEESGGTIPAYRFGAVSDEATYSVSVSKNGGMPLSLFVGRSFHDPVLGIGEAKRLATDYLKTIGYDVSPIYYKMTGAVLTVNFAPIENGVTMYPDLVQAEVALDTGEIVGLAAHGYLMNHRPRSFPETVCAPVIGNERLTVGNIRNVVIPTPYADEINCCEVEATLDGQPLLLYFNAETGREEELFLLTENETERLAK